MGNKHSISIETRTYDMDWNRHVTSRAYEKFSIEARYHFLGKYGYGIERCMEDSLILFPKFTRVRFLKQQFANVLLNVESELSQNKNGDLQWEQKVLDEKGEMACHIQCITELVRSDKTKVLISEIPGSESEYQTVIHSKKMGQKTLLHNFYIPFSDMNFTWQLPSDSIWKIFEEGRFLFFHEMFDLSQITKQDTTTFFMGGEILVKKLPVPGSQIHLHSWIERIDKIRFYFRQDLEDESGNLLCSMRDEQLFVNLSSSRPTKVPPFFLEKMAREELVEN